MLSSALTWAVEQGHLKNHPFKGEIRLEGDSHRETILENRTAYKRLFTTMDEMVAESELRPQVRDIVVLLALTGARRNEIRTMCLTTWYWKTWVRSPNPPLSRSSPRA